MENTQDLVLVDYDSVPAYRDAKANQEQLVLNNPFVEITDRKSYVLAKEHRAALKKGRTDLQKGEKLISKTLNDIKSKAKQKTEDLIDITKGAEEKQDSEVKRWEKILAEEKAEKERLIAKRKQNVDDFNTKWRKNIKEATFETIETLPKKIEEEANSLDVEGFEQRMEVVIENLIEYYKERVEFLKLKAEKDKIEAEKLELKKKEEKLEADKKKIADEKAAKEKAEKEAKEKAEREQKEAERKKKEEEERIAKEKAEKEREEALKPEKQKALDLISKVSFENKFDIKDVRLNELLYDFEEELSKLKETFNNQINNLK